MQKKKKQAFQTFRFLYGRQQTNAIHSKSQTKLTRQLPIMWLPYLHHAQECTTMSWFCEKIDPFVAAGVRFSCLTCKKCSWLAKILYCFHTHKKQHSRPSVWNVIGHKWPLIMQARQSHALPNLLYSKICFQGVSSENFKFQCAAGNIGKQKWNLDTHN